ncbi:hypothetical protein [Streptomyces sp. NPDC004232]|uniref:hypothetical protein n=1 Tax=unclassified Streptomyces TaxID=2593676 RepID=UPI001D9EF17C|nr:hypothetical protein [Streptomyces sp. tea 10]
MGDVAEAVDPRIVQDQDVRLVVEDLPLGALDVVGVLVTGRRRSSEAPAEGVRGLP